jgi:hypothetical protein
MRRPRPEEYDHYPDRELDPKSEERRAFENAMRRYWRWRQQVPEAKVSRTRLSEHFDQSLGPENSLAVNMSDKRLIVFHNTFEHIKTKVTEFGGPDGFKSLPLLENQSQCKAVIFPDDIDPVQVEQCLQVLCPDLRLGRGTSLSSDLTDTWTLVM